MNLPNVRWCYPISPQQWCWPTFTFPSQLVGNHFLHSMENSKNRQGPSGDHRQKPRSSQSPCSPERLRILCCICPCPCCRRLSQFKRREPSCSQRPPKFEEFWPKLTFHHSKSLQNVHTWKNGQCLLHSLPQQPNCQFTQVKKNHLGMTSKLTRLF